MASLSGWTEAGIGVILFMLAIGIVIVSMNHDYGQNYDPTFGIDTTNDYNNFTNYQGTLAASLQGETTQSDLGGLNLLTSWNIIKSGVSMVWSLLTGQWIVNAVNLIKLGAVGTFLAWGLRLLFIFSLGFILIKLLFKVKP